MDKKRLVELFLQFILSLMAGVTGAFIVIVSINSKGNILNSAPIIAFMIVSAFLVYILIDLSINPPRRKSSRSSKREDSKSS